jgi:hypothetical protein
MRNACCLFLLFGVVLYSTAETHAFHEATTEESPTYLSVELKLENGRTASVNMSQRVFILGETNNPHRKQSSPGAMRQTPEMIKRVKVKGKIILDQHESADWASAGNVDWKSNVAIGNLKGEVTNGELGITGWVSHELGQKLPLGEMNAWAGCPACNDFLILGKTGTCPTAAGPGTGSSTGCFCVGNLGEEELRYLGESLGLPLGLKHKQTNRQKGKHMRVPRARPTKVGESDSMGVGFDWKPWGMIMHDMDCTIAGKPGRKGKIGIEFLTKPQNMNQPRPRKMLYKFKYRMCTNWNDLATGDFCDAEDSNGNSKCYNKCAGDNSIKNKMTNLVPAPGGLNGLKNEFKKWLKDLIKC